MELIVLPTTVSLNLVWLEEVDIILDMAEFKAMVPESALYCLQPGTMILIEKNGTNLMCGLCVLLATKSAN